MRARLQRLSTDARFGIAFFALAVLGVPLAGVGVVMAGGGRTPAPARALLARIGGVLEERGLQNVEQHAGLLARASAAAGVSPHLLGGIMFAESRGRSGQRSSAGALGLMQLMPAAARDAARRTDRALPGDEDELETALLHDDELNVHLAAAHLGWLLEHRGEWSLEAVLVSYNAGRTRLFRWIERHGSYAAWARAEDERAAAGEATTGALAYARQVLRARDALAARGKF